MRWGIIAGGVGLVILGIFVGLLAVPEEAWPGYHRVWEANNLLLLMIGKGFLSSGLS